MGEDSQDKAHVREIQKDLISQLSGDDSFDFRNIANVLEPPGIAQSLVVAWIVRTCQQLWI